MKLYIVTDLEGISGVTTFCDTGRDTNHTGGRFDAACAALTAEVNAAVQGALEGGASDIIVNDGHGGGCNFIMEKLHPGARYLVGSGCPTSLYGLDQKTDGVILLGYHAMSGTRKAVLDHTQSSRAWHRFYVNGVETGEIGQMALMAGHYNVPVLCVTGDRAAVEEAKQLLGEIETVAVKEACAQQSAICLAPARARELIQAAVKRACRLTGKIKPYKLSPPLEVRLECASTGAADGFERGGANRLDGFTVSRIVPSALDLLKI